MQIKQEALIKFSKRDPTRVSRVMHETQNVRGEQTHPCNEITTKIRMFIF